MPNTTVILYDPDTYSLYKCPFYNYYNYSIQNLDNILMYKHYISGWLSLFVILIGILANSITICALLHRYMRKSSTNAYLLALSTSNLISLTCLFLMMGLRFTLVYPYRLMFCKHWYENFISKSIPYLTPINNLFQLSGIYLIMAVSIDRFVLVKKHVKPTASNRKRRKLITWAVIFLIFLFCFIFTLPNWFLYKSTEVELSITNNELVHKQSLNEYSSASNTVLFKINYFRTEHTKFGQINIVREMLSIYLYIPFVFGIPIIILSIVNILIIYELIKIGDRKRLLGTAARIDRNITIMLVMIVVVFLVCQVPLTISHILVTYKSHLMYDINFFIYNSFTNFLTCINLSANFALFCFFGQAFRNTIQFMFCIRKDLPDQNKRAHSIYFNDLSRRSSTIFQSLVIGFRRSSQNDLIIKQTIDQKLSRKSLPALNRHLSVMHKISEKDDEEFESKLRKNLVHRSLLDRNQCPELKIDKLKYQNVRFNIGHNVNVNDNIEIRRFSDH